MVHAGGGLQQQQHHTCRYCHRGYCYTKIESAVDLASTAAAASAPGSSYNNNKSRNKKRGGLDFCTDSHGHVMDCDLYEILGSNDEDYIQDEDALEKITMTRRRTATKDHKNDHYEETSEKDKEQKFQEENEKKEVSEEEEAIVVMDLDRIQAVTGRKSWKENPKRGTCFDNDLGYTFDCNLIEVLDDGLVLIEDLRAGGVFAAQPKSGFSITRRKKAMKKNTPRLQDVLNGSGPCDPSEDFRTNVFMNLEGL